MRCSSLMLSLALAAVTGPTQAQCVLCDTVVEMTEAHAACYRANFDDLMVALETSTTGFHTVNLAGCGGSNTDGTRDFSQMGTIPGPDPSSLRVKSVYILDRSSARCLRDLIDAHDGPFDPRTVFRLAEACPGG